MLILILIQLIIIGFHSTLIPKCLFSIVWFDCLWTLQGVVLKNGTVVPIKGTFVSEGTYPAGSMWSTLPVPSDWLGPRCLPGPNDTSSTPNACEDWEHHNVLGYHLCWGPWIFKCKWFSRPWNIWFAGPGIWGIAGFWLRNIEWVLTCNENMMKNETVSTARSVCFGRLML